VIYTFTGPITGGEAPTGSVVFDASGNLYGTTQIGGFCGTAYELSPTRRESGSKPFFTTSIM